MMASTTLAAHSASPFANLPSYNGLRHYYKVRNNQIFGGRNLAQGTMSATSVNPGDQCPDTSKWPSADSHNSEYVVAQHVAMEVSRLVYFTCIPVSQSEYHVTFNLTH